MLNNGSQDVALAVPSQPFVTVLIDTYNYARYIGQAIDSVLSQDYPADRYEVIVVDDGSTDNTADIVRVYGSRVQYFLKSNGGQASAFNFGFSKVTGDIVALLDADDIWLPDKLKKVAEAFLANADVNLVYHSFSIMEEGSGNKTPSGYALVSGDIARNRKTLLSYCIYPTSSLTFRRSALEKLLPVPEGLRTQADAFLAALIVFFGRIAAIPERLMCYRIHDANCFGMFPQRLDENRLAQRMEIRRYLIVALRAWLTANRSVCNPVLAEDYLAQWSMEQKRDAFQLSMPGRSVLFRHLSEEARLYRELRSSRHRALARIRAIVGFVMGYKGLLRFDDWYTRLKQSAPG